MPHPTKSAILGLVAAALGLRNDRDQPHVALNESLGFAVRVDSPGALVRDFHTAEAPRSLKGARWVTRRDELAWLDEKANPVISRRDYMSDARYTVCLWEKTEDPEVPLSKIREALETPVFVLYLGRKSCPPALPLMPHIVEADSLAEVFQSVPCDPPELDRPRRRDTPAQVDLFHDGHPRPGVDAVHTTPVRDGILSRTRRQFKVRDEVHSRLPFAEVA